MPDPTGRSTGTLCECTNPCLEVQAPGSALSRSGWRRAVRSLFIAYAVHQPITDSTKRHRELVARLASQSSRLQGAYVMGVGWLAAKGGKAVGQRSEGAPCCDNGGVLACFLSTGTGSSARHRQ